ncbi:coiled-coil domain-containing protein 137 [Anopheles maculipalpis]|uniref:coiled-coil domain-containing protein 137 n=1 Tax=Anopheles maculipalpis TaxID=1496333 RepID=UPI002159A0D2|nr:coiled-coil domain-containing protein 137 [Anopheles maculipalpis]
MGRFGPTHRKIPVPKRHGVRDPLKRLADREASMKDKINNPPKEHDVQEVSNRFKQFMALANEAASQPRRRKREPKKRPALQIGSTLVEKRPRETEEAFLNRASNVQHDREVESEFGTKFGVEVEHDDKTGIIRVIKRKGIEVDSMLEKISDEKSKPRKSKAAEFAKARKAMLAEQKALKKQKALEKRREEEDLLLREYQYERVPFGEVVKEPPSLHTLPRRATRQGVPRPGAKSLLLSSLLEPKQTEEEEPVPKKKSKKKAKETKLDLKGKRKNLPAATRMKIEREQQNVIELYRQLKKNAKQ